MVVLTRDFKPMIGGVAEYLHNLWNHIARFQPVTVMTPVPPKPSRWDHSYRLEILPSSPERLLGGRFGDGFLPLRKLNTARYFHALRRYAARTLPIMREAREGNCQVFIGIWDMQSHFWCRALRHAGIPYRLHVHGLEVVSPFYGRLPRWRYEDFRNAEEILAVSRGTAELVKARFGADIPVRVVNPGIGRMPAREAVGERAVRLRNELNLPNECVLLTVGRLVPRKGIDLVLRRVAELAVEFPDLSYVVAGDGPERARLQALARELGIEGRVRFLGHVDELTKWALYELCDVFILPNRLMDGLEWEGFGIVFLEAALSGKPAIGGNNGGVPDAIDHGVTGLLVDPEDGKDVSSSLGSLLRDRELRGRMGQAAEERAMSQFNLDAVAAAFQAGLPQPPLGLLREG